jgi:hypothetical protein
MNPIAKTLLGIGIAFIVLAVIWQLGGRWLSHLGRLPGDIAIKKDNFSFYFPVATSILISVALSLILWLMNYFRR